MQDWSAWGMLWGLSWGNSWGPLHEVEEIKPGGKRRRTVVLAPVYTPTPVKRRRDQAAALWATL